MTALAGLIRARIAQTGPMTVAEFMADALMHPDHGYYATRDPFGAGGDFVTAPEISQMFGELLGLALTQCWFDQGSPNNAIVAETGPGRGTLMADMRRVMRSVPGLSGLPTHLVEASPALKRTQAETLSPDTPFWHVGLDTLPDAPLFFVANEFLDALPIRQFVRDSDGWRERVVVSDGDDLGFALGPPAPVACLDDRLADTAPGDMVETNAPAEAAVRAIADRIANRGGAAILIDYGDWRSRGDTLQAVRAHRPEDPLANPGEADLTSHVDFEALTATARSEGAAVTPMITQGVLLERLGIAARTEILARNLTGDALSSHIAAHQRLTHPDEMGTLFKAVALHPKDRPPPPGFLQ